MTALILAAKGGHHECVSILVGNGADVNAANGVRWWQYNCLWRI